MSAARDLVGCYVRVALHGGGGVYEGWLTKLAHHPDAYAVSVATHRNDYAPRQVQFLGRSAEVREVRNA